MEYLAECRPGELNAVDTLGMTALHHVVKWGKNHVKYLVEAGASVHSESSKQQGALHLLYSGIVDPLELYETTKYLLGVGMEQDINKRDYLSESPLHAAVNLVNRKVETFNPCNDKPQSVWASDNSGPGPSNAVTKVKSEDQSQFDEQTLKTIDLLLAFNCDPNIENSVGLTALQKFILTVDYLLNNDPGDTSLALLPDRKLFNLDFSLICQILESLLSHGSDPNRPTPAGWTPTLVFLQSVLKLDASRFDDQGQGVLNCVQILCQNGAQSSLTRSSHINTVSILARLGWRCLALRDETQREQLSILFKDLLSVLVQYGLNSNHKLSRKPKRGEKVCGNILIEVVKLAHYVRKPADLLFIHSWVLALLQWGANPDIEPYPSDPIICQSQSSIFLKPKGSQPVNQFMYQIQDINDILEGGYAEQLLMLFYNSMDHVALYQCLGTAKFLSRFDPNSAPTGKFLKVINNLNSHPRSLRQISRVAIYKAVNRKLTEVHSLPLPSPLKNYLYNIE